MVGKKSKDTESETIKIAPLMMQTATLRLIGTTPLYHNRMSEKARQQLLVGGKKKTAADRLKLKHHPQDEFRASAHYMPDGPTALGIPELALKASMCDASLETPGITRTSAQRLLWVEGGLAPVWGVPMLKMDVVRSADINRTPDVRTRCFLPRWAAEFRIRFISPQFTTHAVVTLLCNAGMLIGVGDYRQQKGKGSFGSFRVIGADEADPEWEEITKEGRDVQEAAMRDPVCADRETEELMAFWSQENARKSS